MSYAALLTAALLTAALLTAALLTAALLTAGIQVGKEEGLGHPATGFSVRVHLQGQCSPLPEDQPLPQQQRLCRADAAVGGGTYPRLHVWDG